MIRGLGPSGSGAVHAPIPIVHPEGAAPVGVVVNQQQLAAAAAAALNNVVVAPLPPAAPPPAPAAAPTLTPFKLAWSTLAIYAVFNILLLGAPLLLGLTGIVVGLGTLPLACFTEFVIEILNRVTLGISGHQLYDPAVKGSVLRGWGHLGDKVIGFASSSAEWWWQSKLVAQLSKASLLMAIVVFAMAATPGLSVNVAAEDGVKDLRRRRLTRGCFVHFAWNP